MTEREQRKYMEALWAKLLTWCAIEESRNLTGLEKIMSQCQANEYDCKVALGWPDVAEC